MPILIAAPHGGRDYPAHVLEQMREPAFSQLRLEDRLIDEIAQMVAQQTGASLLMAKAPRAMLDLNRSKDDVDWEMIVGADKKSTPHSQANRRARSGLGLVPRRLPNFGEIWRGKIPLAELDARIDHIHRPYHRALGKELGRIRDHWGAVLLVDFHSMPPLKKRYGMDHIARYVIGDRFGASCDNRISARALNYLDRQHSPASHNRPYSGGYVLDAHAAPTRGLHAMQLEVCRSLYLGDGLAELSDGAKPLAAMLAGLVRELGAVTARLAESGSFAQAAE
ncbi:MAG: N-formylglutamate amidohydrolase [Marinomonas sp.]